MRGLCYRQNAAMEHYLHPASFTSVKEALAINFLFFEKKKKYIEGRPYRLTFNLVLDKQNRIFIQWCYSGRLRHHHQVRWFF